MPPKANRTTSACGLDIGSNTFTCCAVSREGDRLRVVDDVSVPVRLSEGLEPGGLLSEEAVSRGIAALEEIARAFDLAERPARAVATQVLRWARDPDSFTEPAARIIGTPVEILTGEEEALLAGRGAVLGLEGGPWIVLDIGGRSTEICWSEGGRPRTASLDLGVVSLTERHLASDPPSADDVRRMRSEIREIVGRGIPGDLPGEILAAAGTATTLGSVDLGLTAWDPERVHGHRIGRASLAIWLERMLSLDAAGRTERYGVRAGRADVFPAGLVVLDEILARASRERFAISAMGLRIGAALSLLEG